MRYEPVGQRSAIYEGLVRHCRHVPRPHAFSYRVTQLYLDLDEVDRVFAGRWLWSRDSRKQTPFVLEGQE